MCSWLYYPEILVDSCPGKQSVVKYKPLGSTSQSNVEVWFIQGHRGIIDWYAMAMAEETKPLILFDQDADDSLESWLPSPSDPAIQHGCSDIQDPPLPEGKTHHLFFSHSSADRWTVYNWTQRLTRIYGIRCFLPDIDFKPGLPVIKNIENGMAVCLKIVLVLSPDYVDSGWCDYERFLAFTMSMEERRHCIIPVLLHPCNLPSELVRLNYIDAMKIWNVEERIMEALKDKCELKNILPTIFPTSQYQEPNGICHNLPSEKVIQSKLKGSSWHFKDMTNYTQDRIRNSNMRITEKQSGILYNIVNESFALKYHGIFHLGLPLIVFCANTLVLACCITIALVAVSQWIFRFESLFIIVYSSWALAVLQVLHFLIFCGAWKLIKVKSMLCLKTKVKNLSVKWNSVTNALILVSPDPHPTLVFMRYDLQPCKKYIKARLMELYDVHTTTASEREKKADETATHHINSFLMDNSESFFKWTQLEESTILRHDTLMRKKCVCELVEERLWGNDQ